MIATGTPEEVARVAGSYTGQFLRQVMGQHKSDDTALSAEAGQVVHQP